MAVVTQGVMAGIGSAEVNRIMPEFDALIRDFIIGGNSDFTQGIIKGLTRNGNTLTKGVAYYNGYLGYIPNNVTVSGTAYAVFNIHNNVNVPDSFYISNTVVSDATVCFDISSAQRLNYPKKAYHADKASVVTGSIASGATATTQPVTTANDTVATTAYVMNRIVQDIALDEETHTFDVRLANNSTTPLVCKFKRKAKMVLVDMDFSEGVYYRTSNGTGVNNQSLMFPDKYTPKKNSEHYLVFSGVLSDYAGFASGASIIIKITLTANSNAVNISAAGYGGISSGPSAFNPPHPILGYECQ